MSPQFVLSLGMFKHHRIQSLLILLFFGLSFLGGKVSAQTQSCTLSNNSTSCQGVSNMAWWMAQVPGYGGAANFSLSGGSMTRNLTNGTATMSGTLTHLSNSNVKYALSITLSGGTTSGTAYPSTCGGFSIGSTADWYWYTSYSGSLTSIGSTAVPNLSMTQMGHPFQVGTSANLWTSGVYGGSGWFSISGGGASGFQGDFGPIINCPPLCGGTASASNTGPYCTGSSIQLYGSSSGTTGTVTWSWTGPGGFTSTLQNPISNNGAGTYTLTIRYNSNACNATASTTVVVNPTPATPTATVTQPTCAVTTGTITVTSPTGAGYTYSLNGGVYQSSTIFSNKAPGTYSLVARSSAGCVSGITYVTVNPVPSVPIISAPSVTQPTCAVPTGTIVVNATGSGTLEYSINGGSTWTTSATFTGLASGSYSISVRLQSNPTCVTNYGAVTINAVPGVPVVSAPSVTQPTCAVPTGTIVVNATGSGTLEYSINGGSTWTTSATFTGLASGSYSVSVRLQSNPTCVTNYGAVTINSVPGVPVVSAPSVTQPTCAVPTGTIVVNATGSGTLEYSINGGSTWTTSATFTGLASGSYSISVRLQSNPTCVTNYGAVTINAVPGVPVVSAPSVTQPTCAVPTGTIVVNATGSGTLEYSINGGSTWTTSATFTGLASGSYSVSVRLQSNPTCVTNYGAVTINSVPGVPVVSAPSVTQPTCAVPTGTIVVNATGSGTLEYSINGGSTWTTSATFTGLASGSYSISVRLQSNPTCVTNYGAVTINAVPGVPVVSAPSVTQPTCAVPTGTIVVNATGSGTLEYSINGGSTWTTSATFSGLASGSYSVSVRLQSNPTCVTNYGAVTINAVPVAPVVAASTVTQPTCAVSTGTIVVNATSSGILEYSINGGTTWVTTNTFSGLAPGTYTPRVRLQSSPTCSTTGTAATINAVPTLPDIYTAPTVTHPTCAVPTGSITINATGSSTLEYTIDNGATWTTNNTFTGLAPGTLVYYVQVRLQSMPSCVKIYGLNPVVINAIPSAPVTSASTVTQPTCAVTTGTIVVNATGSGTLEYSINGGTTWGTSNTFIALPPGNYTPRVRLQSSTTCSTTGTAVTINAVPVAPVVAASTVTQPTCAVSTGTIVVNATGSGTLEYSINGGTTWVTTNTFSGLAPGTYTPRVRLQSSPTCSATGTAVTINTVPVLPDIYTAPTVTQPTCAVPTGTMVINATGTGTLEYSIDNGATWSTNNTFAGLAPGTLTYYVQVRLQSMPSCVKIYALNPVVINTVPTAPVTSASTVTQPTCAVTTGTIVVNATGSGTLEYSINGGTTWSTSNTFIALPPGSYTPMVRAQNNVTCSASGTAVTINAVPVAPVVAASTVTQPTCAVSTGTIVVNATGSGTLEYSINGGTTWVTTNTFSGLAPGTYTPRVRLQSSPTCSATGTAVTINTVPVLPDIYTAPTVTHPTCAVPTGSITINATGASALEYTIDNGATWTTNNTFTGLAPGTLVYYVQVRLQSTPSCVKIYGLNPVVINAVPVVPVVSASTVTQPTCAIPTGTIVVNATGSGTLEYSINGGATWGTSNTFIALPPGNYTPRVRLQSSPTCSTSGTVAVVNAVPVLPDITTAPTVTPINCSSSTSGEISITATGSGTLEYSINSGATWQTSNSFTGLSAGSYNVYVRLQSSPSCVKIYGSNPIVLSPPSCRDFTPTIEIDNTTFLPSSAPRDFVINVSEIINGASVGQLIVKVPKISGFNYIFLPNATSVNVNGGTPVNNSAWTKTENSLFITLTLNAGQVIPGFGIHSIGMRVQRNGSVPTQTNQPMTVTIVDASGGDLNNFNNTYNLVIKAQ